MDFIEKRCYKCTSTLPLSYFRRDSSRKDRLSNKCRQCENQAKTARRKADPSARAAQAERNRRFSGIRNAEKLEYVRTYKETTPCADCGFRGTYYCLDFDHTTDVKNFEIGSALGNSRITLEMVKDEMALCELVCAICHRERTHSRGYRRRS